MYYLTKSLPLDPILSQMNTVNHLLTYIFKIYFSIILLSTTLYWFSGHYPSSKLLLKRRFRDRTFSPSGKKPNELGPIDRASPYPEFGIYWIALLMWPSCAGCYLRTEIESSLRNVVLIKVWMMDNVQKITHCINIPSSKTLRFSIDVKIFQICFLFQIYLLTFSITFLITFMRARAISRPSFIWLS
jgi:uncharacterized membrane protein YhaH (DUF805 family)